MNMNLNKDDVLLLIQEYRKHKVLWDPKDKWHFNKIKKNDAWDEIAKCIGVDAEDAKKKISSLLGSFRREKAKARKTKGTGKGAKDIYKSDWFAFNSFAFLMDKDEPRQTFSSEEINGETIESSEISVSKETETIESPELEGIEQTPESSNITEISSKRTTEVTDNTQEEASKTFVKPSTPRRKRRNITENVNEDPRIEKAFQFLQQPVPQEDSTSVYAKYLAGQLNQFDPRTKAILIHKINQLIFEAEMETFRMQSPSHCSPCLSSPPFFSPASTPPYTSGVLDSTTFVPEDTQSSEQSSNIETSSDEVEKELHEFVYLTDL